MESLRKYNDTVFNSLSVKYNEIKYSLANILSFSDWCSALAMLYDDWWSEGKITRKEYDMCCKYPDFNEIFYRKYLLDSYRDYMNYEISVYNNIGELL